MYGSEYGARDTRMGADGGAREGGVLWRGQQEGGLQLTLLSTDGCFDCMLVGYVPQLKDSVPVPPCRWVEQVTRVGRQRRLGRAGTWLLLRRYVCWLAS